MPKLTVHKLSEAVVFRCTGRIVFGECHILRRAVLSHPYIEIVVLDMGEISTIDAAGVGLLVELRKWAVAKRMQLKLLYLTPHVANLLNITHVTPIFDVCSVRDVIDLLFRANQSSLAAGLAAPGAVADVIVPGL
jgi:anti-anti-sigma factor